MAVTRVRDVRARRATCACVKPFWRTTSTILELRSLRRTISAPSAERKPRALASAAAERTTTALDFLMKQLLQALPAQVQFVFRCRPRLLRERMEDQDAASQSRVVENAIGTRAVRIRSSSTPAATDGMFRTSGI